MTNFLALRTDESFFGIRSNEDRIQMVLDYVNINATDKNGNTSLMIASAEGHEAVVEKLIDKKAEINTKDIREPF